MEGEKYYTNANITSKNIANTGIANKYAKYAVFRLLIDDCTKQARR